MSKKRVYDDRTDKTLFVGEWQDCMRVLSVINENDEMYPHVWIGDLKEDDLDE